MAPESKQQSTKLIDGFGRHVDYIRVSVTDRCNLRCVYCMSEEMTFLPRKEVLDTAEFLRLCNIFIERGVRHLRLTGGEPLVRRDIMALVYGLGAHLKTGKLEELTLTTNGVRLAQYAAGLAEAGVKRINVSLDSLDRQTFARIARGDQLDAVLTGIAAAKKAGIHIKINTVALKNGNEKEIPDIIRWAHASGMDVTLIETMPLGEIEEDRTDQFLSLAKLRQDLSAFWTLTDLPDRTSGPARYVRIEETGGRLGLITPLTHNFCATCRRVRLSCTGTLHMCLGQEASVDLREPLRASSGSDDLVHAAIDLAMALKPEKHDFMLPERGQAPALSRHMSVTGG